MSGFKGIRGLLQINSGATNVTIGFAANVRYSIDHNITKFWEIGTRPAVAVMEGTLDVKGSLERAWINTVLLKQSSGIAVLPSYRILVSGPNGSVTISGCKTVTYDMAGAVDGVWLETMAFTGKRLT